MSAPTREELLRKFEEERQQRRLERQQMGLRISGPCLVCNQETDYGVYDYAGMYSRYGNKWLDRQFEPAKRAAHVKAISEGPPFNRTQEVLFRQFLCRACHNQVARQEEARRKERDERLAEHRALEEQKRVQEETASALRNFSKTWRYPEPQEFEIVSGCCQFKAHSLDHRPWSLVFRWRTCLSKVCIGHNPARRVGLWANKRLCAHYYGWEWEDQSDLLGPGPVSYTHLTLPTNREV